MESIFAFAKRVPQWRVVRAHRRFRTFRLPWRRVPSLGSQTAKKVQPMLASRAATSRFQPHGLVPFWFWRQIRVTFSLQNARKAKNDGFPEPRTVGPHSPRGDRAFLSPSGSLLVRGSYVVFPVPRCAADGHFRRTQRRSVSTVGHTFPKTHLTMATQAAVMSAKATKVRTRQSALAAGDNFPALVAFSPRSELRRVGTQALRHLRGVGWARFRPRSGLRDARNVSTTSVGDVRGHSALA